MDRNIQNAEAEVKLHVIAIKEDGTQIEYRTIKEAAEAFGCKVRTMNRAIDEGLPLYNNYTNERYMLDILEERKKYGLKRKSKRSIRKRPAPAE